MPESDEPSAKPEETVYEPDEPREGPTPGPGTWTDEDERAAAREEE